MQTILENLEETYLHLQNILDDDQRGLVELDTENREDIYISFCNTIRSIVTFLISYTKEVEPMDKRVYTSLIKTPTFMEMHEEIQRVFINTLYAEEVLIKEITIGELIEKLQEFAPSLKIKVGGDKFVIDDTYLDRVELIAVKED